MQQNPSTAGQGIYAGYHNPHHVFTPDYRPENPFNDHSPPRQHNGYMSGGAIPQHRERRQSQDAELFIPASSYRGDHPAERSHNNDNSWPLRNTHDGGYSGGKRAKRNSWERGDDSPVYEM
jgi:hypothetical protein